MSFFRWFSALDSTLSSTDDPIDAELLFKIRSKLNALYEGILDKSVAGTQQIKGHDHTKSPLSPYYGGANLRRNQVYIGSAGGGQTNGVFYGTVATPGSWVKADEGFSAGTSRSGNGIPMAHAYVSPGWNTGGSGVPVLADFPYLKGWVKVKWIPKSHVGTISVRVNSLDLGRNGGTNTISSAHGNEQQEWLYLDKIPCQAGWNDFEIEVDASHAAQEFVLDPIILFEEWSPPTGGTYKIGGGV